MVVSKRSLFLALFVVFALLAACLQYPGLNAPMYYDSAVRIEGNRDIFLWEGFAKVINIFPQRPIPMITFYANFLVADMAPIYFRLVNIILLAATAVVVVVLIQLILELPAFSNRGTATERQVLAISLGLFFLVHPLQTYLTLYIWQRMALMACLFYYLSLLSYLAVRSGRIRDRTVGYAACLIFFACALLSKENSVNLPGALILAEIALLGTSWRGILRRAGIYFVITLLLVAPLSLLQHPHGKPDLGTGFLSTIVLYYKQSYITPFDVLLTQCRLLFHYLSIIFVPSAESAELLHPYVISRSILEPPITLPALIGTAGYVGVALYLIRKSPLSGFGLLFFLIGITPEVMVVPIYAFFGYRAVLPMFGLLLVVADGVMALLSATRASLRKRLVQVGIVAALTGWVVAAGWASIVRAQIWNNPLLFWQRVVDRLPDSDKDLERRVSSQALNNLGGLLQSHGRDAESVPFSERAVRLSPRAARFHSSLGAAYWRNGRIEDAEAALKKALELEPDLVHGNYTLGLLLLNQRRTDEGLDYLRKIERLRPYDAGVRNIVGEALLGQGDHSGAKERFRRGVELDPRAPTLQYNLGVVLLSEGKIAESVAHLRKALELKPDYWQAYNNLGVAHARTGRLQEAVSFFQKALDINPQDEATRSNLETALKQFEGKRGL